MTMVLVVEDEPRIRDVLVDTLLDAGFDVADAADGTDAIQMMAERVPDVVLLDVMMPGLDGFQVMQRICLSTEYSQLSWWDRRHHCLP